MDAEMVNAHWRRVAGAVAVSAGFGAPADGQAAAGFGTLAASPDADEAGVWPLHTPFLSHAPTPLCEPVDPPPLRPGACLCACSAPEPCSRAVLLE